jgi:hypothetical protein
MGQSPAEGLGPGQSGEQSRELLSDSLVDPPKILLRERTSAAGDSRNGIYGTPPCVPLVRLDVCELDYLGPLLYVIRDTLAEVGIASTDRRGPQAASND